MWIYSNLVYRLYSVFYVQGTIKIVLCYCGMLYYRQIFLLVYNYTLSNGLRDKELRVGVSGNVADLAHFYA